MRPHQAVSASFRQMGTSGSPLGRSRISGPSPYEQTFGFSRAVRSGDFVFVSGTAPIGEDGKTACPGDAYGQMLRCIEIIEKALKEAGASLEEVVRTRMYVATREDCEAVGRAHAEVFGKIRPAATMVMSELLQADWLVEVEADALVGSAG